MPANVLTALVLTLACTVSLQCVDARSFRKSAPRDDVTTDDDAVPGDGISKRSTTELREVPAVARLPLVRRSARSTRPLTDAWSLLSDDERGRFGSLLADAMLLERLRHRRSGSHRRREVWSAPHGLHDDENVLRRLLSAAEPDGRDEDLAAVAGLPVKRTIGQLRSVRELHPVYLGLGQNAASAALNTYASFLDDEKRRESLEEQQRGSANPVRFIGRR